MDLDFRIELDVFYDRFGSLRRIWIVGIVSEEKTSRLITEEIRCSVLSFPKYDKTTISDRHGRLERPLPTPNGRDRKINRKRRHT